MIDTLPEATYVGRKIPKAAFFRNLPIKESLKQSITSQVESFTVYYSLTDERISKCEPSDIEEIIILHIELRVKDYHKQIMETIAKYNHHKLLFMMTYGDEVQYGIYEGKLYLKPWDETIDISVHNYSLRNTWDYWIHQIAITEEIEQKGTITDLLSIQATIDAYNRQMAALEKKVAKEKQPKKKFVLYEELEQVKRERNQFIHDNQEITDDYTELS